jgi:hypothetical protein
MPPRFINYPTNRLLAVIDEPEAAVAAIDGLVAAGIDRSAIERLSGATDAGRLDGLGASNGRFSRALRTVQFMTMDQMPDFLLYETALRLGRTVVVVAERDPERRRRAIDVLKRAGAHFMNWYGRFATEEVTLWRGPEPTIPGVWRR